MARDPRETPPSGFVAVESGRLCTAWQGKHVCLLEGIRSDSALQMFLGRASFPPDSSEPSVITRRMTLWSAPTQTGGEVRAIAQTFMVGFGQGRKPSFPCERRVVRVGREGREGRPGCPRLSSSWILTFSSPKASCFERLFQNTHPLGVPMGLVCVFLQKDLSGSTGAGVLLQRLTGTLKHAEDVGLWVIEFGREESL